MAAFLLVACGGDDNNASDPDPSAEADFVVDSFDDLSVCIDDREGATAYVKGEDNAYICTNGDWAIDTTADARKKSSSSKDNAKSSSSRCEDCKDDAKSSNSKDKAKSSSSRHCEDCKDEAISSSSSSGQKTAWDYLNPEINYGEMVDDRDGQIYKTVKIGDQVWMAENLNYKVDSSWCGGGENSTEGDCSKYGRLYTWASVIDSATLYKDKSVDCGDGKTCSLPDTVYGICPPGWHVPDTTELNKLIATAGGTADRILKSQTGWNSNGNGTDAIGFSALPAGHGHGGGGFCSEYACAEFYFWSAIEYDNSSAYVMGRSYFSGATLCMGGDKYSSFSIRCLKNDSIFISNGVSVKKKTAWDYLNSNINYGEMIDNRDSRTYKTVKIGDHVWMAENLNYETENSWCGGGFSTNEGNCSKYGRLYTWTAAVGKSDEELGYGHTCGNSGKVCGVCPEGWHLPDTTEWNNLVTAVGGEYYAGKMLKSQTGWLDDGNGTNSTGFSALPAGRRDNKGYFNSYGLFAFFWSATENDSINISFMGIRSELDNVSLYIVNKDRLSSYLDGALSVRCVQD